MKVGYKVRFVNHHKGSEQNNTNCGLVIGKVYEVEGVNEKDGTTYINGWCCTYSDEIELVESQCEIIEDNNTETIDPIVESVINQFKTRSEIGIKKYGTTLERNDLSTLDWLKHLQEEMMDAVLYIEKLKSEL
jgi:hypothetical protein